MDIAYPLPAPPSRSTSGRSDRIGAALTGATTALAALALILVMPGAALAQVKAYAFVPNHLDNNVTVIDAGARSVLTSAVPAGSSPFWATASPDGRLVYVANALGDTITVIDVSPKAAS